ncbi:MAG: Sec-independent protein translocase protein TatB [Campylobacterales bacterium]
MLDIGSTEFLVIVIVMFLVLGPEKFPDAMRGLARFIFKIKRMVTNLTSDLSRELQIEEMRAELERQREEMRKLQEQLRGDLRSIDNGLTSLKDLTGTGHQRDFKEMLK